MSTRVLGTTPFQVGTLPTSMQPDESGEPGVAERAPTDASRAMAALDRAPAIAAAVAWPAGRDCAVTRVPLRPAATEHAGDDVPGQRFETDRARPMRMNSARGRRYQLR